MNLSPKYQLAKWKHASLTLFVHIFSTMSAYFLTRQTIVNNILSIHHPINLIIFTTRTVIAHKYTRASFASTQPPTVLREFNKPVYFKGIYSSMMMEIYHPRHLPDLRAGRCSLCAPLCVAWRWHLAAATGTTHSVIPQEEWPARMTLGPATSATHPTLLWILLKLSGYTYGGLF